MARRLQLEDFDTVLPTARSPMAQPPGPSQDLSGIDLEDEKLKAFEKGYKAGWDDAASAHAEEQSYISTELSRNLQDLSFTYSEAHAAFVREVDGLMQGLLEKVLPGARGLALSELILVRVKEAARSASFTAEIVVSPQMKARVENLLPPDIGVPVHVQSEPALAEGQAFLRMGRAEEQVDVDAALEDMTAALARFLAAEPEAEAPGTVPVPQQMEENRSYG